jgi:hypothetical protein
MSGDIDMGGKKVKNAIANMTAISGNQTVTSSFNGNAYITSDGSGGATWTLPNNAGAGTNFAVYQGGAGQITFSAASGATVAFSGGAHTKTARQYAAATVVCVSNGSGTAAIWVVSGATA